MIGEEEGTELGPSSYPHPRAEKSGTDPWQWLEKNDEEAVSWMRRLNGVSLPWLQGCRLRPAILRRLAEATRYPRFLNAYKANGHTLLYANISNAPHSSFYMLDSGNAESLVVDTSAGSTTWQSLSPDGSHLAYGRREKGTEKSTAFVCRLPTTLPSLAKDVCPPIPHTEINRRQNFFNKAPMAWLPDNSGLFLTTFPIVTGSAESQLLFRSLTDPSGPHRLLFQAPSKHLMLHPTVLPDGTRIFLIAQEGLGFVTKTRLIVSASLPLPAKERPEWKLVLEKSPGQWWLIPNTNALFATNDGADLFKIVRESKKDSSSSTSFETLIPEQKYRLKDAHGLEAGRRVALVYLEEFVDVLYIAEAEEGGPLQRVELPGAGTVKNLWGGRDSQLLFRWESDLCPGGIYELDSKAPSEALKALRVSVVPGHDPKNYRSELYKTKASDGMEVGVRVLSRKDTPKNGSALTLLSGYGGFGMIKNVEFDVLHWLVAEAFGGFYASAYLRGGGEEGNHRMLSGQKKGRLNVHKDFNLAAELLIREGIAKSELLVATGISNGGLSVLSAAMARPRLYAAVAIFAPPLDMLRFHTFRPIGPTMISEFGNPEEPRDAEVLAAYSPYHNIPSLFDPFPPLFIGGSDKDPIINTSHTTKFMAKFYETRAMANAGPALARFYWGTGHVYGMSSEQLLSQNADLLTFIGRILRLRWTDYRFP